MTVDILTRGQIGPEMQLERWVEVGRPRNEAERKQDLLQQHGILDLQPRTFSLGPEETRWLTVTQRCPFVTKLGTFNFLSKLVNFMNVHETASASTASSVPKDCDFEPKFKEGSGVPIFVMHW